MNGITSIDFSAATPVNASNFRFDPQTSSHCHYSADYDTWVISAYGMPIQQQGAMALVYQADSNEAVLLNLLLCGALNNGELSCALTVKINGTAFITSYPVTSSMFFTTSWYIPKGILNAGSNLIELDKTGISNVFVRSASIMRYDMQPQQQTQWCWAAVSASTSTFFDATSTWTQCQLANTEFKQSGCCQADQGGCPACNQPYYLQNALTTTGNFASQTVGAQTIDTILAQLGSGRPVGVRIEWPDGSGHFVMVTGVGQGLQMLSIDDPLFGHSYISYTAFVSAYRGNGKWNYSYFVQP